MSELKNKSKYSTNVDKELLIKFKELSAETRITSTKLLDEAIEDLLKKYKKL